MTRRIPPPPEPMRGGDRRGQARSHGHLVSHVEIHQGEIVVRFRGVMALAASRGECAQQSQPLVELSDLMLPVCLLGGFPAPWGGWQHAFGIVLRNETHV